MLNVYLRLKIPPRSLLSEGLILGIVIHILVKLCTSAMIKHLRSAKIWLILALAMYKCSTSVESSALHSLKFKWCPGLSGQGQRNLDRVCRHIFPVQSRQQPQNIGAGKRKISSESQCAQGRHCRLGHQYIGKHIGDGHGLNNWLWCGHHGCLIHNCFCCEFFQIACLRVKIGA